MTLTITIDFKSYISAMAALEILGDNIRGDGLPDPRIASAIEDFRRAYTNHERDIRPGGFDL